MADDDKIQKIHKAAAEKAIEAYIDEVLKQLEGTGLTLKDWHGVQIGYGAVIVDPASRDMVVAHVVWKFSTDPDDLEKAMGRVHKPGALS